jgi:hypothetical protein
VREKKKEVQREKEKNVKYKVRSDSCCPVDIHLYCPMNGERERRKEQDGTDSLAGNDKKKKGNERLADPGLNVDYLYNYQTR